MPDDVDYITPHEAALAVVATSMKKARLRLDTLIINSIVGGVLFSCGGMLHLSAQAENPDLYKTNPGIVHFMQGSVYPIALFYVVILGADLFNSNVLYFSVGVCRGAVSILDLLISWSVSWFANLGANIFICYVICNLSGTTQSDLYVAGSIEVAMEKESSTFMQSFLKAIAANFAVSLAVYLQLLAKPIHVKFLMMFLPVFTFVSMGYNHAVADMFLIPMGMFNGAPISVGRCIWHLLIPTALGNIVGGSAFGIVIPWYLHLVVVERDRRLLNLPEYEVKDEQPELEMDSRVVRVPTEKQEAEEFEEDEPASSSDTDDQNYSENYDPISYRPGRTQSISSQMRRPSRTSIPGAYSQNSTGNLSRLPTNSVLSTRTTQRFPFRSPPGVFPVKGMGEPLSRERTIASSHPKQHGNRRESREIDDRINSADDISLDSDRDSRLDNFSIKSTPKLSTKEREKRAKERQKLEEEEYTREGGYNARENNIGENLKRVFTRRKSTARDIENAIDQVHSTQTHKDSNNEPLSSGLIHSISRTLTHRQPETQDNINRTLSEQAITPRAASASDNIAGIDSYDLRDTMRRPSLAHRHSISRASDARGLYGRTTYPSYYSGHDNDNFEQQSIASNAQ